MTNPSLVPLDEVRLSAMERNLSALAGRELRGPEGDPRVSRYLEAMPPGAALQLVEEIRLQRRAMEGAVAALATAGFTPAAYSALDEAERATPTWQAVRRAWEAIGLGPAYVLRYNGGQHRVRSFPTPQAALDAAIEAVEMCDGYPEAIEMEDGLRLMDSAAILRAWEDRHDPG